MAPTPSYQILYEAELLLKLLSLRNKVDLRDLCAVGFHRMCENMIFNKYDHKNVPCASTLLGILS